MDLANSKNWHLVSQFQKAGSIIYQNAPNLRDATEIRFQSLPPSEIQLSSPVFSIYVENYLNAEEHWYLGAWASLSIQLNERWQRIKDSNGEWSNRCRLKENNLLIYPFIEPIPYRLKLDFPYWHRGVIVEVWEFIDSSGRYLNPLTEGLRDWIEGEEIILKNRTIRQSEIDPSLTISRFVETTIYEIFQVGRFYTLDNREVADPMVYTSSNRLIAEFTGREAIAPGTIKVRLAP